ncbi:type IV secretion system protein [Parasutterella sp.]|uniref:type IV secretion system protein n=1 Tax=Parasutterella sp. TaxID=2049037 RepID=UPI003993D92D
MAGTFETFGNQVRNTLAGFANSVSGEIISSISPIVYTGIMLYFFVRAYQITTGRAEGAIPDLVTQCVKIVLVAFFGLNAANFVTYVIPAVYGIENLLLNAISNTVPGGNINNAWGAADATWDTFMTGFSAIYNIWSKSSWSVWSIGESIATSLFILLLMGLMLFVSIYFMLFAVGYLLLYEIFLVMGLAFGPLFICSLMFTVTRTWFDGWLKAVVCWAFTLVAVAGTLLLIDNIFSARIQQIVDFAEAAEGGKDFGVLLVNLGVFAVVVLAIATVVKSIPSFAAGLTGGVALQAASVAGMLQGFGRTMAAVTGGAMLGYAGGMYGRANAQDTDYAKENRDALKSQAQHLLGSGGLTNPGAFAAATAGYAAGAVRQFFTDPDKLRTPTSAGSSVRQEELLRLSIRFFRRSCTCIFGPCKHEPDSSAGKGGSCQCGSGWSRCIRNSDCFRRSSVVFVRSNSCLRFDLRSKRFPGSGVFWSNFRDGSFSSFRQFRRS